MQWKVRIRGDTIDLDELCASFRQGDVIIEKAADDYLLTSSRLEVVHEPEEVLRVASSVFEVAGLLRTRDDGGPPTQYTVAASVESSARIGRPRIIHSDGAHAASATADPFVNWYTIATKNDAVAGALERLRDPDSWGGLYNVYEIVRDDVDGDATLVARGWTTNPECSRFRRTACSPAVLGGKARHGVQTDQVPSKPMSLPDASAFVRRLVQNWVTAKAAELGSG